MSYTFFVPTRTIFGTGMLNELHNQAMPGKKALLVTSCGKSARERRAGAHDQRAGSGQC